MKIKTRKILFASSALTFIFFSYTFCFQQYEFYKEIPKSYEKELRVKIESSFKKVVLSKGYTNKILTIQYVSEDEETPDVNIRYNIDEEKGYLTVDLSDEGTEEQRSEWHRMEHITPGLETNAWYIKLNNSIPIRLNVDLGAGSGNIDISGLILKEFKLSTGVASTSVTCNEPNQVIMDVFYIEAGFSKFYGGHLGNANFKTLTFDGSIGSYSIDLSGDIRRESYVNVDIGLGSMNIILPANIGAQVRYDEGFLSSHTFEDFKKIGDGKYISSNYYNSDGRLNIKIESGVGNVRIKRVERR
jgi:hypothetical protein